MSIHYLYTVQCKSIIYRTMQVNYIYLVDGLEHVLFFHILGIMILTDFHIFQRG